MPRSAKSAAATPALLLAGIFVLIVLAGRRMLDLYSVLGIGRFSAGVRRVLPRSFVLLWAPLLPIAASTINHILSPGGALARIGGLACGLFLVEVFGSLLRRESWISAYEPWLLPSMRPLGGWPNRQSDARLQRLLVVHVTFAAPILLVALCTLQSAPWEQIVLTGAFFGKYVGIAHLDHEAVVHWQMHCGVLGLRGRPVLSATWEVLMDWTVGMTCGYIPRIYNGHHLLIHHVSNGGSGDIHSTQPFRRDSFLEFSRFALLMCMSTMFALDVLPHKRCRGRTRAYLATAVSIYWVGILALLALGSMLGPLLIVMNVIHAVDTANSQYLWHGLVDPSESPTVARSTHLWIDPEEWLLLSLGDWPGLESYIQQTSVADGQPFGYVPSPSAHWAFLDDLHFVHHLHSSAHFTDYPHLLRNAVPRVIQAGSVILDKGRMGRLTADMWAGDTDSIASYLLGPHATSTSAGDIQQLLAPSSSHRDAFCASVPESTVRAMDRVLIGPVRWVKGV